MSDQKPGFGVLGCRAVLAAFCLMHGLYKFGVFGHMTIRGFAQELDALGIAAPTFSAYFLSLGLVLSGAALLIGCFHKIACGFLIAYLLGSIWFVSGASYFNPQGFEYAIALLAVAIVLWREGPGPMAYVVQFESQKAKG
ncbi:MAG: DoxX family membrane protein [Planctomycetota bacterium]|jgi:putative oxidoreductase